MCWTIPNGLGDGNEVEGPALVTAVNMDTPFVLYIYCGTIEFDGVDGLRLNRGLRSCRISMPCLKNICSFSGIGWRAETGDERVDPEGE
jgi:hypothetical protein